MFKVKNIKHKQHTVIQMNLKIIYISTLNDLQLTGNLILHLDQINDRSPWFYCFSPCELKLVG